jgi:hypothetical protein
VSKTRTTEEWRYILGNGHWEAFNKLGITMADIEVSAAPWSKALAGVERAWLCWNVDPAWCLIQQKLVREVGWTPVVGYDPRVGPPPLVEGAICIDFNAHFKLPTMWMHFPMEFVFVFCDRLAFWHSDLLVRRDVMRTLADQFAALPDGATAAVAPKEGNLAFLYPKARRYWELVGCTTRAASRSQFENGAGWWMNIWMHPSNTHQMVAARTGYYYDHGTGVRFWHKKCKGDVRLIAENFVSEGHCTRIGNKNYVIKSPDNAKRDLSIDLSENFELHSICRKLEIDIFQNKVGVL